VPDQRSSGSSGPPTGAGSAATSVLQQGDRGCRAHGWTHKFRHTFASIFLAKKPDLYLLSKLGHSSFKVTEDIYAHLVPGSLEQARDVVGGEVPEPTKSKPRLKVVVGGR